MTRALLALALLVSLTGCDDVWHREFCWTRSATDVRKGDACEYDHGGAYVEACRARAWLSVRCPNEVTLYRHQVSADGDCNICMESWSW